MIRKIEGLTWACFTLLLFMASSCGPGGEDGENDSTTDPDLIEPDEGTDEASADEPAADEPAAEDAGPDADVEEEPGVCPEGLTDCAGRCVNLLGKVAGTADALALGDYPVRTRLYDWWVTSDASGWTSGFLPGILWAAYESTGETAWRTRAETWTAGLEDCKNDTTTHDVGFQIFSSFGRGYLLTGDAAYRDVVITTAGSLATRFNPTVGALRSWSWGSWRFPVIIDNMMNLEILFWASKNGGDAAWYDMAVSHALTTMENHVRGDGSIYHLVDFDPATGEVVLRSTWQGYADDSTWARGQAWAVHGFTMTYRETEDAVFLEAARRVADFFIDTLPPDAVPYWDFDAPGIPDALRDSSAAAIAASGLLELSTLATDPADRARYADAARSTLASLCTPDAGGGYLAEDATGTSISPGLLMRGCQTHPDSVSGSNQCDESLIFGDYYFLEALMRAASAETP